jgi:hypothetical protein
MKTMKHALSCVVVAAAFFSTMASATLISGPGGMIYDTDRNITWLANANLFKTQSDANPNLVNEIIAANSGVIYDTPNVLDGNDGIYDLSPRRLG